jgi:plasmid stabilization system protein ParE
MRIRWSADAVADLENIVDYIRRDNPAAAQRVGQTIYDRLSVLATFPYGGRRSACSCFPATTTVLATERAVSETPTLFLR